MTKIECIRELFPEVMVMDGYDDCILGVIERIGMDPIVCYDKQMVLMQLQCEGSSYEEAVEWYEYNMVGAWVGDATPCFLNTLDSEI